MESDGPQTTAEPVIAKLPPQAVELARTAVAENRLEDAERMLERILLADPKNLEARLLRGEVFLAKGNPNRAMTVFSPLQDLPDVSARARQGLGISMMLTEAPEPAVEHLNAAVAADPSLWRAWNALGSYHDSKGEWADAIKAYDLALAEHPNDAMILSNRGYSFFMQGRLEEAIPDMQQALQLDPDLRPARVNLRLALAWSGRYVHAMTGVSDRELPEVLNNIGYIAMLRGDLENAEAYLMRAMEEDPSFNETAWRNLAHLRQLRELNAAEQGSPTVTPRDITAAAPSE